jgi:antitoxin MazE
MRIPIRRIGKSKGLTFPTSLSAQIGLQDEADVSVEDGVIVVRVPASPVRAGWAEASKALAAVGDDALVMPQFVNQDEVNPW